MECDFVKYSDSEIYYMELIKKASDNWHNFAGKVLVIGVTGHFTPAQILEYLLESFHTYGSSINEIPKTTIGIEKDMELYFKTD